MIQESVGNFTDGVGANREIVGHYTQVVWSTTYEVGCGYISSSKGANRNYGASVNSNFQYYINIA